MVLSKLLIIQWRLSSLSLCLDVRIADETKSLAAVIDMSVLGDD